MGSKAMDVADACPTEDFIAALLEYLVEPKLQGESSSKGDISQIAQESIAKQVPFLLFYCMMPEPALPLRQVMFFSL